MLTVKDKINFNFVYYEVKDINLFCGLIRKIYEYG